MSEAVVNSVTFNSDCYCGENELTEDGRLVQVDYCDGDCWRWSWEDYEFLFDQWLKAHPDQLTEILEVDAEGVGWMRQAGSAFIRTNAKELLDLFTLDGGFRLIFTFEGKDLTVRRWSHDEPTGSARFIVRVSELDTLPDGDAL